MRRLALEFWHETYDESIEFGYDAEDACRIADDAVLKEFGRDWSNFVLQPGAVIEYTP